MFELVGLLAKYFGAPPWGAEIMRLKRSDLIFWYRIYELQVTEEEIANEILNPPGGKPGKLPEPEEMRRRVDERITKRQEKLRVEIKKMEIS